MYRASVANSRAAGEQAAPVIRDSVLFVRDAAQHEALTNTIVKENT